MKASPLYNLIKQIEYGTNLHIGVMFFGNYANTACEVPHNHKIHEAPVCNIFKTASRNHFFRCVRCRNLALKRAVNTKAPFGGLCVNGVYEYTHPVIIGGEVAAVIFVGNILDSKEGLLKITDKSNGRSVPFDTMEADYSPLLCKETCETLENYIRYLLDKYSNEQKNENPLIKNIKSYIESNLEFGMDIHILSTVFHYNCRYLGRLFKKETNMTLSSYITSLCLEKSKKLLAETNRSIIDISTELGFNNVTYFNKLFKAAYGTSPTAYRQNAKNNT